MEDQEIAFWICGTMFMFMGIIAGAVSGFGNPLFPIYYVFFSGFYFKLMLSYLKEIR